MNTPTETAIGVDVGGTFTDVALLVDDELVTAKVPTTDDQSVGVLNGIEKTCSEAGIAFDDIDAFTHAMTVSVNALLERDGAKTALVTTAGFRDVLEIGRQDRPELYDLDAEKPAPLVPRRRRFEIDERATADGVERAPDRGELRSVAEEIRDADVESVAVCLLHAYVTPDNEQAVADALESELDVPVSTSHEVLAEFREFERTATTVVDAYVTPGIDGYVGRLASQAADAGLPVPRIMQANGGVADAETVRDHAVTTAMSGPAAGVVGAAASAHADKLVTFDMGGTSTDVSLVRDGSAERTTDATIDDIPIRTPMVDVNTVGAGGGSVAWLDSGGALRVGPRSAGAYPGPACYDRGGTEPTVTDANVVLGYIGPETALGGELTLDVDAARDALSDLAARADLDDARAAARGIYRVANATMTRAIRSITVERGHDPRSFGLVAFGGAGPMHAPALAESLDIERVYVPWPAGVLSAFGLLAADEVHDAVRTVRTPLPDADSDEIGDVYRQLAKSVREDVSEPERATIERAVDCRYEGQSFELTVPVDSFDAETVATRFHEQHESVYGYALDETVEAVSLRTTATVPQENPEIRHTGSAESAVLGERPAYFPGSGERTTTIYDRSVLPVDATVDGPAVLEQDESTTVVPPGWRGTVHGDGAVVLEVDE